MIEETSLPIHELAHIDDVDMMKLVLSSGDYFPGFYRYTLGTQKVGDESLGLNTLVWLYFEQKLEGRRHHKEDWLELQHEVHDRDVASEKARNAGNFPEVRDTLSESMMSWYFDSKGLDLIYLDTQKKVSSLEKNKTYYFMGSLIRQQDERLSIGHNALTQEESFSLACDPKTTFDYIKSSFTKEQIEDLFLEADIIGRLEFHEDGMGTLNLAEEMLDELLIKDSETKIFGAPIESSKLPIRFAKSIRLSNFKRGEDGKFQLWKTDQNW